MMIFFLILGRIPQEFVPDDEEEAIQAAIRESLRESRKNLGQNASRASRQTDLSRENLDEGHLSGDELRRRRLQRFQR